jgi:hypothetical protein
MQPIPANRVRLVRGEGKRAPAVGDIGKTDQCFTGRDRRPMVMVYFVYFSVNGVSEREVEAYESELEPTDDTPCATNWEM